MVAKAVPILMPLARVARRVGGRWGARLFPIAEYGHLGISPELNREWSVLDTFDMLSPAHDHPQSIVTVRQWFADAGFTNVVVERGSNGVVGRGEKPPCASPSSTSRTVG
ncbi:MAG: hypothetical protein Q8R16_04480, partial [bacterium]|nr:hypothetical protein [bacterium]